jgi:hypothetical protein
MGYTLGRGWIEMLRIDTVELNDVGGLRFNVWTSIVLFVLALAWFLYSRARWPGRDEELYLPGRGPEHDAPAAPGPPEAADQRPGEEPRDHGSDTASDPL